VGDTQEIAFLKQFQMNSNSPFTSSIISSLDVNYHHNTSSGGFFADNKDTFTASAGSAVNAKDFLAGKWSKGGTAAWFALTTQKQNNPLMLSQATQNQLAAVTAAAQSSASAALNWGSGFLSWCGATTADSAAPQPANVCLLDIDDNLCHDAANKVCTCPASAKDTADIKPGDPCTDKNGKAGSIKTPGSTIKSTLDKALGLSADKLLTLGGGAVGNNINTLLNDVATVMTTVDLAKTILGSPGSKGLAGSDASFTRPLLTSLHDNTIATTIQNSGTNLAGTPGDHTLVVPHNEMKDRLTKYESSWGLIRSAADYTSTALTDLKNSCPAQSAAAQDALDNEVTPILSQADDADSIIAAAEAMKQQVQNESDAVNNAAGATTQAQAAAAQALAAQYTKDAQTLEDMQPTDDDVAAGDKETQTTPAPGGATADPTGSLTVTGGTIVDRLALISSNAAEMQAACQ
jgi:hypothetical protein